MHREQTRISARTPLYGISFPDTLAPSTATAGADNASRAFRMPGRTILRKVRHAAVLCTALLVGAVLLLGQAAPALAHRVNIFAWVEGGTIRCESSFSSGNPARDAKVTATLAGSGTVMGTAVTDAKGRCALPITPELRAAKADLIIEVQGGEGHRNTWTMPAEEYLAAPVVEAGKVAVTATATTQAAAGAAPEGDAPKAVAPAAFAAGPSAGTAVDEAALRRIVA
ncbi:hypothetical protein, partial [Nitratidesulfovibrio liaohensis]|uniref:hypothetical protein n=1 Tax=Nitratidesulfovibrio liaohensis TaxID=2604158 RepID=UPI00141E6B36